MHKAIIPIAIAIILVLGFLFLFSTPKNEAIRVGWQPPWVNQGQISAILQKTDILQKNGVEAKFTGFSFGPPMTEAALSGQLDILFLGDQPAFNLIAKDNSWKIVSPLVNYKSAILVPTGSEIKSVQDLRGKTIATGIGSTTYRDTIQLLNDEEITDEEITVKNLDVGAQLAFMQSANGSWGEIDAMAAYDPTVTLALSKGLAKPVTEYKSLGVIAVNNKFYNEHPEKVKQFINSVKEAFEYYQKNSEQANQWYSEIARYSLSTANYAEMASLEPKMQKGVKVEIALTQETKQELQKHLNTAISLGLIKEMSLNEILLDYNELS
ncbi:MAG TPA: NrtA/SsuA/CpmA family ABC transporter substrate-binding protein [archaeon]|nr:NrtA/SsuA/CpmA family ABC transporter substrate-binding protein [archaeon]